MAMSDIKSRDVFTGDDFLVAYERLTKQRKAPQQEQAQSASSPRDATKRVLDVLTSGSISFNELLERSDIDFLDLGNIVARLQKIGAVVVSGTGAAQTIA